MKAFIFDVDGTLTPSRQKIDKEFKKFFLDFQYNNPTYIVTGSDYQKTLEQVGREVCDTARCVFNCSGNEVRHEALGLIHAYNWTPKGELFDALYGQLFSSPYPDKTGAHVELRTGTLNFSIVGRNATSEQRRAYVEYDRQTNDRVELVKKLSAWFPYLEFVIGGETGIDIYEKGRDKSQVLKWINENETIFFGDACHKGGNDYSIAKVVDKFYNVKDWKETYQILSTEYAGVTQW